MIAAIVAGVGLILIITLVVVFCLYRKRKHLLRVHSLTPGKVSGTLTNLNRDIGSRSSNRNLKCSFAEKQVDEVVVEAKPNYADHSEIEKLDMKTFKEFLDYKPPP